MRRLATLAAALMLCGPFAFDAAASGATTPLEYVPVSLSGRSSPGQGRSPVSVEYVPVALAGRSDRVRGGAPASVEYVPVALAGHMSARHGDARHARRCRGAARNSHRHAGKTAAARARRRGRAGKRRCRARRRVQHPRPSAAPSAAPSADGVTGSANSSPSTPATGVPAPNLGAGQAVPPSGSPPAVARVQVTATEYSYTLSRTSVPAGRVIVQFVNRGQDEHNLKLAEGEGELAGSFPNAVSGGVADQSLILRAGSYTLFCSLPGHESKGMKATLLVQ